MAQLGHRGAGLERRQAIAATKRDFKQRLEKYRDEDGDIVLFYESNAEAVYDDSPRDDGREWRFSELQVPAGPSQATLQNALLAQPLRAPHYSQIAHSDNIIPEAFHDLYQAYARSHFASTSPGMDSACSH